MDDQERQKLIEKLDNGLDAFIQEKIRQKEERVRDGGEVEQEEELDIDAVAEELKNHPAFMKEFDPSKPLHPAMEGLQQLKYESECPDHNAEGYKDDGNNNFKMKKYRWAIDSYAAGIKCQAQSKELNAMLYSNRAAAHFHLGNFRSSLNDSIAARKFKPDHIKAIIRGIQCCLELKRHEDAKKWCDDGLLLNPKDEKFLELRVRADKLMRQQERDRRRAKVKLRQDKLQENRMLQAIQDRGIRIAGVAEGREGALSLDLVEAHHPSGARVKLDEGGALHWPVMFIYPQYGETDYIEAFHEQSRFAEHMEMIFGSYGEPAPWDKERQYRPNNIKLYFEDRKIQSLFLVDPLATLQSVLKDKRYEVQGGTPSFIVLPDGCEFTTAFLAKYNR